MTTSLVKMFGFAISKPTSRTVPGVARWSVKPSAFVGRAALAGGGGVVVVVMVPAAAPAAAPDAVVVVVESAGAGSELPPPPQALSPSKMVIAAEGSRAFRVEK